jgi:1-acyl-sn-glycerol-3-phosphate acyltransferase
LIRNVFNRSLSPRRRVKLLAYHVARFFVLPILRVTIRLRSYGLENIPPRGGALLVCNHVHNADPVLVVAGCSRPVQFMAKKELWKVPVVRNIADISGAFPVERGTADRDALRTAGQKLKDGMLVAGFPEGTRSTNGLKEPFRGLSLVALHNNAPVIPVGIVGSSDLPGNGGKQQRRTRIWPRVTLVFGEPFHLDRVSPDGHRWRAEDHAEAMMIEIAKLLPPAYRGIYADRVDETHPAVNRESITFLEPEPKSLREWFRRES